MWADAVASGFNYMSKEQIVDVNGLANALKANMVQQDNRFKKYSSVYGIDNRR